MIKYVVGFLFSPDMSQVVLVQKNRPQWQAGKYNGVGGKVEANETSHEAMVREFWEETGLIINRWRQYCTLQCPDDGPDGSAEVVIFYTFSEDYTSVQSITDEAITIRPVEAVMAAEQGIVLPNLPWLIAMAKSFHRGEGALAFTVTEHYE